jgi:hypothetical protein
VPLDVIHAELVKVNKQTANTQKRNADNLFLRFKNLDGRTHISA